MIVYEVDCDDCPGDETATAEIASAKATKDKPASLLSVTRMTVADVDSDGQFEVVADAEFLPCCAGESDRRHTQSAWFEVQGSSITRRAP